MATIMEADVTAVCGPKGCHNPGWRHNHERGPGTPVGHRVTVTSLGSQRGATRSVWSQSVLAPSRAASRPANPDRARLFVAKIEWNKIDSILPEPAGE